MQRWASALLCAGLTCALSGCRHRTVVPPLPQISAPVELVDIPEPPLPMVEVPQIKMPPMPTAVAATHPHRERRRVPAKTAMTQVPSQPQPAETDAPEQPVAIGALSTGGDSNPRSQQEAADMMASIEKRLNGLSAQVAETQKSQISKVRNFQKQAQEALGSGDVEGAKTLATKAKLLLDDIEQQ